MAAAAALSEQQLKQLTGHFDLEDVRSVDISRGSSALLAGVMLRGDLLTSAVAKCLCVETLVARGHELSGIGDVTPFTQLRHLDMSRNRITSLQALRSVPALQELHIAVNDVKDVAELDALVALPLLTVLDVSGNPVARGRLHVQRVLRTLPRLLVLDGLPVAAWQAAMHADDVMAAVPPVPALPAPAPWVTSGTRAQAADTTAPVVDSTTAAVLASFERDAKAVTALLARCEAALTSFSTAATAIT